MGRVRGWESSVASYGVALVVAPLGGGPQQACPAEQVERWTPRPGDWVRRNAEAFASIGRQPDEGPWKVARVDTGKTSSSSDVYVEGLGGCVGSRWLEPCAAPASRAVPWGQIAQIASASIRVAVEGGSFGTPTPSTGTPPSLIGGGSSEAEIAPIPYLDADVKVTMSDPFARAMRALGDACGAMVASGAMSPEEMAAINESAALGSYAAVANRMPPFGAPKATETAAAEFGRTKPPEPPRDHNATCPRCGKRAYQGIGDIRCVEPVCDDPETRMPDSVARVSRVPGSDRHLNRAALGKRGDARRGVYAEARYRASGRGVTADHPTEEGAVLVWRAAVAAKDGAA